MQLSFRIQPRTIALVLTILSLYLAAQSLFNETLLDTYIGHESTSVVAYTLDIFSVNLEESIPTWYSTLLLFFSASLLATIALNKVRCREPFAAHWMGLALLFLYLSIDEGAAIHEILSDPLQAAFNTSGFLEFGWQIVAAPLVGIIAILYVRFLLHLPPHIRNLILLAGGLYVGGALVVEGISANVWSQNDGVTLTYLAVATVEELFEMLGVVTFIYALLIYINEMPLALTFRSEQLVDEDDANGHPHVRKPAKRRTKVRLMWVIGLLIIGMNALFIFSAVNHTVTEQKYSASILFYQAVLEQYPDEVIAVTRLNGVFEIDDLFVHPVIASLQQSFGEVMIVALPSSEFSVAFAGSTLPFDRTTLTEVLHEHGETQYIIFAP